MRVTMRPLAFLLILALAGAAGGCSETTSPQAGAPELPPVQSMQMDLSLFRNQNQQAAGVTDVAGTKLNFWNAAVRASFVDVTVVTILTPPSLAFAAALNTIPSQDEDGSYLWIYTWVDDGQDYQIRLRGTPEETEVAWELSVVLPGARPEVWFYGRSQIGRDEGWWIFRDFEAEGDPEVLRVDWRVEAENDASLDLVNIHQGDEEEGDALRYLADGDLRSITFTDASIDEDWDILWNAADGSGSLRVPDYNDGQRACWDENQEDVDCPEDALP